MLRGHTIMFKEIGNLQSGLRRAQIRWRDCSWLVSGAGGLVSLLGIAVLAGWAVRVPALIHGRPGIDTIPPSGALGFLLCGMGLAAAAMGGNRWAMLCGGSVALLGGTHLIGHLFGAPPVVDSLLYRIFSVQSLAAPGGMPPGGAAAFFAAGAGIVAAASPLPERWRFLVLGTAGAVVAATGILAWTGYIVQVDASWDAGLAKGMPGMATIGFALVGGCIAVLGVITQHDRTQPVQPSDSATPRSIAAVTPLTPALPILGIGLLLISILVFLWSVQRARQADDSVRHTLDVIIVLNRIEKALANKETGYRGFVITGQERFLEPYYRGRIDFAASFGAAKQLTADNPELQRHLATVLSLSERWDDFAQTLIGLRQGVAGASRARALVSQGTGQSLIDGLRAEMDQAASLEVRLLAERKRREIATRTVLTIALLLCVVGGMLASMSQFLLTRKLESQRLALVAEIARRAAAEERFRILLDQAPQPIIVSDAAGRIVEANAGTAVEFGYGREELIGQSGAMLIPARHQAARAECQKEILAERKERSLGPDLICVRKDGSEFPAVARVSPVQTLDGPRFITSLVNISERKQIEDDLKRANLAFEAANTELEAFAYSVSHDLRQPLRGMTGFAQILLEDFGPQLPPQAQEYLGRIQRASTRMGQLIDDLLTLSRISRDELRRVPVNLSVLAAEVLDDLRKAEPERQVECLVAEGLEVSGDARLLRVLLNNLLGNAWKFTLRTALPRIEFGADSGNAAQAFLVRDNGAGFDMAYADKLFGAFQRLHDSHEFPGTGIGLAIAQRIINRHGGRIWAEGKVGQGATFYFTV